jgi:hypothetical protein
MPTTNPRLMVTISPEQDRLLGELARFQGRAKSSYLRELLDGAEPLLGALLPVLRVHAATIEGQPVAMRDVVSRVFSGAFGDDPVQLDLVEAMVRLAEHDPEAGTARPAPSGAREERTAPPPSSNTGVSFAAHAPKGGAKHRRRVASK